MLHVQLDVTIHEEDGTYNIEIELRVDLASAVRAIEEFGSLPSIPSDTSSASSTVAFVLAQHWQDFTPRQFAEITF